jgi:hypothetical protein
MFGSGICAVDAASFSDAQLAHQRLFPLNVYDFGNVIPGISFSQTDAAQFRQRIAPGRFIKCRA